VLGDDEELLELCELALLFELRLLELLGLLELDDDTAGVDELDEDCTLRLERLMLDSEGRELEEEL
jgi:hypothetical protein